MPAPVSFNLSLAPLPANFNGTPQDWATAVVNRLTITPSAPWSSFQNGGTIGSSNVGPILYNGMQWKVWSTATGSYVDLVVAGGGLVNNSVPLSAMSTQTPGGLFIYDASGNPTTLAPSTAPTGPNWISGATYSIGQYVTYAGLVYLCVLGTSGTTAPSSDGTHWTVQSSTTTGNVLTQSSAGLPVWQALPAAAGAANFEVNLGADQVVPSGPTGPTTTLNFNTVEFANGCTYDTVNKQVTLPANQTWYLYLDTQYNYQISNAAPAWASGTSYTPGTYVTYSSSLYQCTTAVSGSTPPNSDTSHWLPAVSDYGIQIDQYLMSSSGRQIGIANTFFALLGRGGLHTGGIFPSTGSAQTVYCNVQVVENNASSTALTFEANGNNTRFGGFRIA